MRDQRHIICSDRLELSKRRQSEKGARIVRVNRESRTRQQWANNLRREREITSGFDDLCLKSNTSRIDYYIDIITISIRLGGGKQAERRERKRKKKNIGSNLFNARKTSRYSHLRDTHRYRRNRLCSERKPAWKLDERCFDGVLKSRYSYHRFGRLLSHGRCILRV